jgi:hypothetical protein
MTSSGGMTFEVAQKTGMLSGTRRGLSQRGAWKLDPGIDENLAGRRSELERR